MHRFQIVSLFLLTTYLVLTTVSKKVFSTFKCTEYEAHHLDQEATLEVYLAMDHTVDCTLSRGSDTALICRLECHSVTLQSYPMSQQQVRPQSTK